MPIAILWYPINVSGGSVFKLTGVVTTPVNHVTEKGLVRRGLNFTQSEDVKLA